MPVFEKEIFAVSMVKFFGEGCTAENECASGFFYEQAEEIYLSQIYMSSSMKITRQKNLDYVCIQIKII